MTDFDNGYKNSNFKRQQPKEDFDHDQDGEEASKMNEKAGEYMRELLSEKIKLNNTKFPISCKLIDQEVSQVQVSGRTPPKDFKYVDVFREKPVKVAVKVLVPIKEHPKFNFVGKLLGPKGNTLKQLQEETMCRMAILGRGSMRDKNKEEELRNSLDPKHAHLTDELHVEVSALAPPAEAHARIAYALAEVKKYLIPDPVDMMRGGPPMRDMGDRGYAPGPPPMRPPPMRAPPMAPPRPMPGKSKVISILDRARSAMESSYPPYDDPYAAPEPQPSYTTARAPRAAPEPDYYYEQRGHDRFYEDEDPYYKEDRDAKSSRAVGTRRPAQAPRPYRAQPYARPLHRASGGGPGGPKKRPQ